MPDIPPSWKFPFQRPVLPMPARWASRLEPAYAAHRFSNFGPLSLQLEQELGERVGRAVVLAANGTAAITCALMALDRQGAVILPSFTFPATFGAVVQAGLIPVLADVGATSWELTVEAVDAAARCAPAPIAAVLGVRTFGLCRDWTEVERWCDERGVPLLLDSAAALGGQMADGRPAGCQAAMETFSLHATKVFAIGEGGAIACDAERVPQLRKAMNFGLVDGVLVGQGFNGKMSEFAAAIGLAENESFDAHLRARRIAAEAYRRFFQLRAPGWQIALDAGNPPWQAWPTLAPTREAAVRLEAAAAVQGIQTRRYYRPALHTAPVPAPAAYGQALPVSADLAERMLCLPMYSVWAAEEIDDLLQRLDSALSSI